MLTTIFLYMWVGMCGHTQINRFRNWVAFVRLFFVNLLEKFSVPVNKKEQGISSH